MKRKPLGITYSCLFAMTISDSSTLSCNASSSTIEIDRLMASLISSIVKSLCSSKRQVASTLVGKFGLKFITPFMATKFITRADLSL